MSLPEDLQSLKNQLNATLRDAEELVCGLTETQGSWRAVAGSWSVAECFDHLAVTNHIYIPAMQKAAALAREQRRMRIGPAIPGRIGRWFIGTLEPPVKSVMKMKSPKVIRPRTAPVLADAFAAFLTTQREVETFLDMNADLDLAGVRFVNPLVKGIRFSLATGLHNILAHERRHLWQARIVRRSLEALPVATIST